jgi:predicted GTPase
VSAATREHAGPATATQDLARRVDALGRFVRTVAGHVADEATTRVEPGALATAGRLAERAATRLRLSAEHTVVAVAGATGSGKSSLFNAVARLDLSPVGYLRPTTSRAHACVWGGGDAGALLDWLGVEPGRRFARESALDAEDEAALRGLVLVDLPDVDSVAAGHRLEAERLVGVVDLVIWVLDPQKYADQTVHDQYLRHMGALRDVTAVVFNQVDRLAAPDVERSWPTWAGSSSTTGSPASPSSRYRRYPERALTTCGPCSRAR